MTTTNFAVTGLTCGYCIAEVMERVRSVAGVTGVTVDLVRGGPSPVMVTSGAAVVIDELRDALGESRFEITGELRARRLLGAAPLVSGRNTSATFVTGGVRS